MANLANRKSVARGQRIKLNDAVITGTGSIDFDMPGSTGADWSVLFQSVGTQGALSIDLQFSLDGGTTFNTFPNAGAFLVAATPFKELSNMIAGAWYRLNITGAPTSVDIWVIRN
jgi:hypothetical protein